MGSFFYLSLLTLLFWNILQTVRADHCDPKTDTKVLLPKADDKNYHYNATEEESCALSYRSILDSQRSPTADDGCKIRGFHLNDGKVGPYCIPEIGELPRDELFSTNDLTQQEESTKLLTVFLECTSFEDFKNAALYYKSKVNPMLFSYAFSTAIANREDTESFSLPSLHETQPDLFFNNGAIEEANKKLHKDEIKSLRKFEERRTDFKKINVGHEKKKYLKRPDKKVKSSRRKKPQHVEDSEPQDVEGIPLMSDEPQSVPEMIIYRPANRRGIRYPPTVQKAKPKRKIHPPKAGKAKLKVKLLPLIPPPEEQEFIEIKEDLTGNFNNPEHRVAYFREDIALNSHHWHWHTIYPMGWPITAKKKDRKGELFYYMHCQMIKRYNGARLAENLTLVKPLHVTGSGIYIEEGYYPHLTSTSTHNAFSGRPNFMTVRNIPGYDTLQKLIRWINEVKKAIHAGVIIDNKRKKIRLTETNGIDLLGSAVERSSYSPNSNLYGNIHNLGHILISYCHDHKQEFKTPPAVLHNLATALRDPAFWRWHKMVDDLLNLHKVQLPPYSDEYLNWTDIIIESISLTTNVDENQSGQFKANTGYTLFKQRSVDLARGLDFSSKSSAVKIKYTHLDHLPFTYSLKVTNLLNDPVEGQVRIFISPKFATDDEIREHAIEMDRFTVTLQPGDNNIERPSSENVVTMDPNSYWSQMIDLDNKFENKDKTGTNAFCGCGWPYHLLLPKGTKTGINYVLFAMVSNWINEKKNDVPVEKVCGSSLTMCGVKFKDFPDNRPMGFPLDRPLPDKEGWFKRSNMILKPIKIFHLERKQRN